MTAAQAGSLGEHLAEKQLKRRVVECQIWREANAKMRDVACNFAPAVAHAGELEDVRAIMRDPAALDDAVTKRIEEESGEVELKKNSPTSRLIEARAKRDRLHEESAMYAAATMRADAVVAELEAAEAALKAAE